jgi:hypothetical protein
MWEPYPLATLWASMAWNRDIFTFYFTLASNILFKEKLISGSLLPNVLKELKQNEEVCLVEYNAE